MKNIKLILAIALVAVMAALAVAADPVGTLYISGSDADGVAISINAQYDDAKIQTLYAKVVYDNTILIPCEEEDFTATLEDPSETGDFVIPLWNSKKSFWTTAVDTTYEEDGNLSIMEMNLYTQTAKVNDDDIVTMWFAFAPGKTRDDLVTGTFYVDSVYFGDDSGQPWANNYTLAPGSKEFTFINDVELEAGPVEDEPVISQDNADFRVADETTSGLRFKASFLTELKATVSEYGYLATVESAKNALPDGYTLDMDLLAAGKAVKGIAFKADPPKDISFDVDGDRTIVAAAVVGTPVDDASALQYAIAVRPYYISDTDAVFYGAVMRSSPYQAAVAVKAAGGEAYYANKDYIDHIIEVVTAAGLDAVVLDVSSLFED